MGPVAIFNLLTLTALPSPSRRPSSLGSVLRRTQSGYPAAPLLPSSHPDSRHGGPILFLPQAAPGVEGHQCSGGSRRGGPPVANHGQHAGHAEPVSHLVGGSANRSLGGLDAMHPAGPTSLRGTRRCKRRVPPRRRRFPFPRQGLLPSSSASMPAPR